jgi:hypothetical protein
MKLCSQCHHTPWPYLVAAFISTFAAFLTWLILGYNTHFDGSERLLGSLGMFFMMNVTLTRYMMACMKRHCRHGEQHRQHVPVRNLGHRPRPIGT